MKIIDSIRRGHDIVWPMVRCVGAILVVLMSTRSGLAYGGFQSEFETALKSEFATKGYSLADMVARKMISISLIDESTQESAQLNGNEIMGVASMGKWSCALAAADLILRGKLIYSEKWEEISSDGVVARGDLHAMMQASSNRSAHRVCREVNEAGSPSFATGKVPCYSNMLMETMGFEMLNINLFNGGQYPRCVGDLERWSDMNVPTKTTNVGTANGFARLLSTVYRNRLGDRFDWLKFNPHHQGRSFDDAVRVPTNRFYSAFGCHAGTCPITLRKSGSLSASVSWDYLNADSVTVESGINKFTLVAICNEPVRHYCQQAVFDAIASSVAVTIGMRMSNYEPIRVSR